MAIRIVIELLKPMKTNNDRFILLAVIANVAHSTDRIYHVYDKQDKKEFDSIGVNVYLCA